MSDEQQFEIYEFDLTLIPPGKVIYVIGKRGSGKSILSSDLIFTFRGYTYGLFFNGTPTGAPYIDAVPPMFMHEEYKPEVLEEFYNGIDKMCTARKEMGLEPLPSLIVFDDMSYEKNVLKKDKTFHKILRNGRNRKMTVIYIMHDVCDLNNDLRDQSDFVFAFANPKRTSRERLYKYFFGQFDSFRSFNHVFSKLTEDYTTMVCDCTSRKNNVQDSIYYYRAQEQTDFMFGSRDMWDFFYREQISDARARQAHITEKAREIKRKRAQQQSPYHPRQYSRAGSQPKHYDDREQDEDTPSEENSEDDREHYPRKRHRRASRRYEYADDEEDEDGGGSRSNMQHVRREAKLIKHALK